MKGCGLLLADTGSSLLTKVLTNQAEAMSQVLGRSIQDVAQQPSHAVVIARSDETIGAQEASCSFQVVLTKPTFRLHTDAMIRVSPAALHAFQTKFNANREFGMSTSSCGPDPSCSLLHILQVMPDA